MADDGLRIVSAPADDGLRIVEPPKPAPARTARGYEPLFSDPALQAMIEDAAETAGAGMEQMQRGLQTAITPGVSPFVQAARGGLDYGMGTLGVLGSPFAPLVKPRADLAREHLGDPTHKALEPVVGEDIADLAQAAIEGTALLPDMLALGPEMAMRQPLPRSLPIEAGIADRVAPAAAKEAPKPVATPREPTGYTLHEAPSSDGLTRFEVRDADGKRVANVSGQRQGDAFFINSLAPEPGLVVEDTSIKPGEQIGPNDLGPAIVRDLQAQLLAKTGASRVTGERITGARAANTSNVPSQPGAPSAFQQKWAPFVEGMDKVNAEMRGILDTLNDIRTEASRPKSAGPGLEEGARAARENVAPEVPPIEPTQGKPLPASPEPLTGEAPPTEAPPGPGHNNPPEALTTDEPPPANFQVPTKRNELTTTGGGGKGGPPDITFGPRGAFDDGFGGGGIAGDVGSGGPPKKLTFRSIFDELHNSARSVGARIQARMDPLRIKLQDKMLRLKRVEEATERARALAPPDEQSAYLAEELYHGITGEKLERFRVDTVDPLVNLIAKSGAETADLNNYLYARHAIERNRQMARINPEMPDGGSGMTNAEAIKVPQDFGPGYTRLLEGLAKDIDKVNDGTLDILVEGGLITPAQRTAMKQTYRFYMPLKGFEMDVNPYSLDANERARIGQGWDIRGPESKRALGRETRAGDILSHVIMAREEAIVRAEKNRVGQAFLRFVLENPDPRLWQVDSMPVELRLDAGTGLALPFKDTRYMLSDNVLGVKTGGQQHFITIKDPQLAAAMKNLGAESMNVFFRALSHVNQYMSWLATRANPAFPLPNLIRDFQTAVFNLNQFPEAQIKGMSLEMLGNMRLATRAIWDMSRGRRGAVEKSTLLPKRAGPAPTTRTSGGKMVTVSEPTPREYWQIMAQEFAENGGKINFFGLDDLKLISKRIRTQVDSLRPGRVNEAKKLFRDFVQVFDDVNNSIENATRLAAYEVLRRNGVPAKRAASIVRNFTVNFNRKGEWGPHLNSLFLFYNANAQGTTTFAKTFKRAPVAAAKLAAGAAALGIAIDQVNNWMSPLGPDGVSEWDKMTTWEKDHNLVIMMPGDIPPIKWPLAYGLNVLPSLGRRVSELMRGAPDTTPLNAATGTVSTAMDSFNPLGGGADQFSSVKGFVRGFTPSAVRPFVELSQNQDYAGRPIQRPDREFGKPIPEAQRGFGRESAVAQWITNALSEATGGTKHQSGDIDLSPATLDYLFEAYTGGLGRFVSKVAKLPFSTREELSQPRNWPIVDRFISSKNQWYTNARFYAVRDAIEAVEADWRDYMRKGDRAGIASLRENNGPEFSVMQQFNGAQKQLEGLYKQRKLLNATPAGARQQQERIDALEDQIRAVQARALKAYQDALKREGQR